jgi:hypothetical protein
VGTVSKPLVERPERVFQVWAYTVGMGRLLLRSTKSEAFSTRVDVVFQNVKAVCLPTELDGLVVAEAEGVVFDRIVSETGLLPDAETVFFGVECSGRVGYVVAGVVVEDEDEGEYFEPSRYWSAPQA